MPVETRAAAEDSERHRAGDALAAHADALSLIFVRLPPKQQVVTIGALSPAWRQWAAQRLAAIWVARSPSGRALAAERAARDGNTAALDWARTAHGGVAWNGRHLDAAVAGSFQALQWLRDHELPRRWDNWTWKSALAQAAGGGHLATLQWLREQQCPWDKVACILAAQGGHLETLKWLRAQEPPCPWDEAACSAAARGGHLEALKWLRAQEPPCPWTARACRNAVDGGHLETLQWLCPQEPPCPWDAHACLTAAQMPFFNIDVANWIREHADD